MEIHANDYGDKDLNMLWSWVNKMSEEPFTLFSFLFVNLTILINLLKLRSRISLLLKFNLVYIFFCSQWVDIYQSSVSFGFEAFGVLLTFLTFVDITERFPGVIRLCVIAAIVLLRCVNAHELRGILNASNSAILATLWMLSLPKAIWDGMGQLNNFLWGFYRRPGTNEDNGADADEDD